MPANAVPMPDRINRRSTRCGLPVRPDPATFSPLSLVSDIERLCDPQRSVSGEEVVNLIWKYFFSYVFDGAHDEEVSAEEIAELYSLFIRHDSLNEPGDDIETMNRLRRLGQGLCPFADLPRLCAAVRGVILHRCPEPFSGSAYLGLDLMAGSGLLLLAQHIQARRCGFENVQTWGLEPDEETASRTYDLIAALGVGGVVGLEPSDPRAYAVAGSQPAQFVANSMLAAPLKKVDPVRLFGCYQALFGKQSLMARNAGFYPEGVIAYCRSGNVSLVLSRETDFQAPDEYSCEPLIVHGLLFDGRVVPNHRVGADFCRYLI